MTRLLAVLGVIRSTGGAVRRAGVAGAEAAVSAFDANPVRSSDAPCTEFDDCGFPSPQSSVAAACAG